MRVRGRRLNAYDWLTAHTVDVIFRLVVAGWLLYVIRLTRKLYFWSDDLLRDLSGGLLGWLAQAL